MTLLCGDLSHSRGGTVVVQIILIGGVVCRDKGCGLH